MVKAALNNNNKDKHDAFIYQTVRLLLNKKTKIELNLGQLNKLCSIPTRSFLFFGEISKNYSDDKYEYSTLIIFEI